MICLQTYKSNATPRSFSQLFLVPILYLIVSSPGNAQDERKLHQERVVFSISVSSELNMNEIGDGGFDHKVSLDKSLYKPDVQGCGREVLRAFKKWADKEDVSIVKKSVSQNRLFIHFLFKQIGFYELSYRYKGSLNEAYLSLMFYGESGHGKSAMLVDQNTFSKLSDALGNSISCNGS